MSQNISKILYSLKTILPDMIDNLDNAMKELYSAVKQDNLNGYRVISENPLCVHGPAVKLDHSIEALPVIQKNGKGYRKEVIIQYSMKQPSDFFRVGHRPANNYEREELILGLKEGILEYTGLSLIVADEFLLRKSVNKSDLPQAIKEFKNLVKKAREYIKKCQTVYSK